MPLPASLAARRTNVPKELLGVVLDADCDSFILIPPPRTVLFVVIPPLLAGDVHITLPNKTFLSAISRCAISFFSNTWGATNVFCVFDDVHTGRSEKSPVFCA